jgi:hypothetical protein
MARKTIEPKIKIFSCLVVLNVKNLAFPRSDWDKQYNDGCDCYEIK